MYEYGSTSVILIGVCMIGLIGALGTAQYGSTTAIHVAVQVIGNNGVTYMAIQYELLQ
jgi:hypothetical protein